MGGAVGCSSAPSHNTDITVEQTTEATIGDKSVENIVKNWTTSTFHKPVVRVKFQAPSSPI